jgi:putative thioredoxin
MSEQSFSLGGDAAAPSANGAAALIKDTTTQTFAKDVLEESRRQPVLVDFWAPWCGPCKQLTPVIEKVVQQARGTVKLVKMNIDDHPQVAGQLGIQSIPAVIAFVDGRPVDGFMGALPEGQIKEFIERVAGPAGGAELEAALAEADALVEQGDFAQAAEVYAAILAAEPDTFRALVGLIRCDVATGNVEAAKELLDSLPDEKANDPAVTALKAQIALADQAADLGEEGELRARIETDGRDFDARFELALLLNAKDQRQDAANQLLDIFRLDRSWEEDKARKQLVQFFEAWGPTDAATLYGRRRLSSLLFS